MSSNGIPILTVSQLNSIFRGIQDESDTEHIYRNVRPPSVYHPDIYGADDNLYAEGHEVQEVQEAQVVNNIRVPQIISKNSIIAFKITFKITG